MKKIYTNKSDEVALVAEKIIDSEDKEIVLSIPKFSHLAESLSNFHLIKREAEALGKKVIIESVDDRVVELAEMGGLEAINPFFAKSQKQFSDIIAPGAKRGIERVRSQDTKSIKKEEKIKEAVEGSKMARPFGPPSRLLGPEGEPKKTQRQWRMPSFRIPNRAAIAVGAGLIVVVLAVLFAVKILPRAEIKIVTQKANWAYKDSVAAEKSTAAIDAAAAKIPGQVFIQKKNAQISFQATGKKKVEKAAGGAMTVYNAYSSDPQPLVARTRFVTPDGKVFRLTANITVPGAKIVEGKIVPLSIETQVVADKPGEDYNIGPISYFSIPGFKDTPKYAGFYGETKKSMSGGFIGEVAYPTEGDIKKAKTETAKTLEDAAKIALFAQAPKEFKVIEGASRFDLTKQDVNVEVDESGNFSVFVEGKMELVSFREEDVLSMLAARVKKELGEDYKFNSFELTYGVARGDFGAGKITFPIDFKGVTVRQVDIELLRERVLGKSEIDLKSLIFALPGLESAQISLWPFWVKKVPNDKNKVKIVIE